MGQLPQMNHVLYKAQLLISYAQILIAEGQNMEAVQDILENTVNFVYAALMAGPYTLLAIFDGPLQQLIQIK